MAAGYDISPQAGRSRTERASTRVVTHLRTLIDTGELQPGDQIPPERALARRLNVSRQSLRAGIAFLGMVGVLKICHGIGTYVLFGTQELPSDSTFTSGEQHRPVSSQLFEACCVIEGAIAGLAAERSSNRYMTELADEVVEMYAAFNDPQKYSVHDVRFHRIISRAAGNPILDALLETLAVNFHNSQPQQAQPSQDLRQSAEMHHEIYRAVRSRNPIRAKNLMERHLREHFPYMDNCG
jgi:GntR family transcriptional repressor for pyruvate dehydrogenase complex